LGIVRNVINNVTGSEIPLADAIVRGIPGDDPDNETTDNQNHFKVTKNTVKQGQRWIFLTLVFI
jgi:hypothetical protein